VTLNGSVWLPVGPSPVAEGSTNDNGMVTSIAFNPNNPKTLYIGTVAGGVWRSRDGGDHWTPLFDRQLLMGIGDPGGVAVDPNNTDTIYAGTSARWLLGDANPTYFNANQAAQGLYKSTDGGNSWIQLGSGFPASNTGNALTAFFGTNINVVIVDPQNSNNLYCGTQNGVWTSNDGGQNWTQGNNTIGGDARTLVLDSTSPAAARILYAGISGVGVFTSTDSGANWTLILAGGTPVVAAAIGPFPNGFGKVVVALAPPTPIPNPGGIQVIYVSLQGTGGAPDPVGLFETTNQGFTWTQATATGMPKRTQGGYSFHMGVDPASPGDGVNDIIYFGTVSLASSTNSGASFTSISGVHSDNHTWTFVPQTGGAPTIVYVGTDGGISVFSGGTWTSKNSGGLQTGLFYNVDVKPDASASVLIGALQDNDILTTKTASPPGWFGAIGGDGWNAVYDGQIAGQTYASAGYFSNPCTRVFVSTNDGVNYSNITPWGTLTDGGCYLAPLATDPSNGGVVYASGNQNLWQSRNGGGTWRILNNFGSTGAIDVAPTNGNNVVIAIGTSVFVTTNALAISGVTFTNITRNLPGRTVSRARFDPADPTIIYAVLGGFNGGGGSGHVFRTTIGGSSWVDISPTVGSLNEPLDLPFNAIAMDGTTTPTTLFVGTDLGVLRSMDGGNSWSILDDLHFPRAQVSDLVFNPLAGVLVAATYGRGVFKFGLPAGPAISVGLQDNLAFGTICGGTSYLTITVYNVGVADLIVFNVQVLVGSSDFSVLPTPATPVTIDPGEEMVFTVAYNPSVAGVGETAIIRITSNDPTAPFVDVQATGIEGTGQLTTAIADNGDFGKVCLGAFADEPLVLNNSGQCPLSVLLITSTSGEFQTPSVVSFPINIAPSTSVAVPIRFQPAAYGVRGGSITIFSTDPASPATVAVFGIAPAPRLALAIADKGSFGHCCVGSFVDEPLLLSNSGECTLSVVSITSSAATFLVPEVLSYPLTIEAGSAFSVPIRFEPTSLGPTSATITVVSNDPASPATISVTGDAPPGKLAVCGSAFFGGVKCCKREQRRVSICNVGDCTLHVRRVRLRRRHRHFHLILNPFPAPLHPGACLDVVIEYHATEHDPRWCELVIESDDPTDPVRHVLVEAWTIWDCCEEHCCKCRKEGCDPCCECVKRCGKRCDDDDDRGHRHRGHRDRDHGERGDRNRVDDDRDDDDRDDDDRDDDDRDRR